ncbi:hypothetical protein ACFL2C_01195 [Patescibacteria group bacterium]
MGKREKIKIVSKYKKSVYKNTADIKSILVNDGLYTKDILRNYERILTKTSETIVSKWKRNEKYVRTEFVLKAFAEFYPEIYFELSIQIDAMINILDDLLDEKLDHNSKITYVLEYLRVFSIYCLNHPKKEIQLNMSNYFNKLITLAIAEPGYIDIVSTQKDMNKIVSLSIELLMLRSHDVDIFVQIAASGCKDIDYSSVKKSFGIYRALNILKKDIVDIDHDKKNKQSTMITHMLGRKNEYDFKDYVTQTLSIFELEFAKSLSKQKNSNKQTLLVLSRLEKMFKAETEQASSLLNTL